MSGAAFLLIAVALSLVGSLLFWLFSRKPTSWDSGISEFNKNMDALKPEREEASGRRWGRRRRAGADS